MTVAASQRRFHSAAPGPRRHGIR